MINATPAEGLYTHVSVSGQACTANASDAVQNRWRTSFSSCAPPCRTSCRIRVNTRPFGSHICQNTMALYHQYTCGTATEWSRVAIVSQCCLRQKCFIAAAALLQQYVHCWPNAMHCFEFMTASGARTGDNSQAMRWLRVTEQERRSERSRWRRHQLAATKCMRAGRQMLVSHARVAWVGS